MQVFVVIVTSYGEGNEWKSVDKVFDSEYKAIKYVEEMNSSRVGSYSPEYEYEECVLE